VHELPVRLLRFQCWIFQLQQLRCWYLLRLGGINVVVVVRVVHGRDIFDGRRICLHSLFRGTLREWPEQRDVVHQLWPRHLRCLARNRGVYELWPRHLLVLPGRNKFGDMLKLRPRKIRRGRRFEFVLELSAGDLPVVHRVNELPRLSDRHISTVNGIDIIGELLRLRGGDVLSLFCLLQLFELPKWPVSVQFRISELRILFGQHVSRHDRCRVTVELLCMCSPLLLCAGRLCVLNDLPSWNVHVILSGAKHRLLELWPRHLRGGSCLGRLHKLWSWPFPSQCWWCKLHELRGK
jgi:hypothetical protein